MISEGSCDTEHWSNDAKNAALITGINYILNHIKIEKICKIAIIFYIITVLLIEKKSLVYIYIIYFENIIPIYVLQNDLIVSM